MLSRLAVKAAVFQQYPRMNKILIPVRTVTYIDRSQLPKPMPFDGPNRDTVNFPRITRLEYASPCRFLCIPDTWFQFVYNKTGATGLYTLGVGLWITLCSKEYIVLSDHGWPHFYSVLFYLYLAYITPLGQKLTELYKTEGAEEMAHVCEWWDSLKKAHVDCIEHEKTAQWQAEGEKMLYAVKKENIALQLEAEYRTRIMQVYEHVKRRLDYQIEVGNILGRVQKKYMVDWITDKVRQSITADREKETLKKCISDLQLLAAKA